MSDAIQPCPGRVNNGWDRDHECMTCKRFLRPDTRLPALQPMPAPCPQWLPMPGYDYVD